MKQVVNSRVGKWGITLVTASLIALVAKWEGTRFDVYLDVGDVPTVCEGYTGPEVKMGDRWTREQCDVAFHTALAKHGEGVLACMTVRPSQQTYEGFASFGYNVGVGAVCKSTAIKKWNAGDAVGACNEFRRWINAGGKPWKGLINRRQAEEKVCLGGIEVSK